MVQNIQTKIRTFATKNQGPNIFCKSFIVLKLSENVLKLSE